MAVPVRVPVGMPVAMRMIVRVVIVMAGQGRSFREARRVSPGIDDMLVHVRRGQPRTAAPACRTMCGSLLHRRSGLPHLDLRIGQPVGIGMARNGVVDQVHPIGSLSPTVRSASSPSAASNARGKIRIPAVVQDADLPWSRDAAHDGRETDAARSGWSAAPPRAAARFQGRSRPGTGYGSPRPRAPRADASRPRRSRAPSCRR